MKSQCNNVTFGVKVKWQPSSRTSQFDFHLNASSLTSFEASSSPQPTHSVSPHLTYLIPHRQRHRVGRTSMYEPEEHSAMVSICKSSTYRGMRFIILERHLVTKSEQSVGRNQTSFFVKSSASSSVLVREYWLDDEGSPSVCHRYWSGRTR